MIKIDELIEKFSDNLEEQVYGLSCDGLSFLTTNHEFFKSIKFDEQFKHRVDPSVVKGLELTQENALSINVSEETNTGILYQSKCGRTLVLGQNNEHFKNYISKITLEESSNIKEGDDINLQIDYVNNNENITLPDGGCYSTFDSARDALVAVEEIVYQDNLPSL